MSKPREYWIRKDSHNIKGVFYAWNDLGRDKSHDCIKVIEKSAYDKAIDKIEKMKQIITDTNPTCGDCVEDQADGYTICGDCSRLD
jgi:hypothetical protein